MVITMDGHARQPTDVVCANGFEVGVRLGAALAFERRVGEFVDRMVLNDRIEMPSFITRFRWDDGYPWLGKRQPKPIDYFQGRPDEVLDVSKEWAES